MAPRKDNFTWRPVERVRSTCLLDREPALLMPPANRNVGNVAEPPLCKRRREESSETAIEPQTDGCDGATIGIDAVPWDSLSTSSTVLTEAAEEFRSTPDSSESSSRDPTRKLHIHVVILTEGLLVLIISQ